MHLSTQYNIKGKKYLEGPKCALATHLNNSDTLMHELRYNKNVYILKISCLITYTCLLFNAALKQMLLNKPVEAINHFWSYCCYKCPFSGISGTELRDLHERLSEPALCQRRHVSPLCWSGWPLQVHFYTSRACGYFPARTSSPFWKSLNYTLTALLLNTGI